MIEQPPARGIARLQWVHSFAWLATAAAVFAAGIMEGEDGGGDLDVWFGLCDDPAVALERAREAVASGAARQRLEAYIEGTQA